MTLPLNTVDYKPILTFFLSYYGHFRIQKSIVHTYIYLPRKLNMFKKHLVWIKSTFKATGFQRSTLHLTLDDPDFYHVRSEKQLQTRWHISTRLSASKTRWKLHNFPTYVFLGHSAVLWSSNDRPCCLQGVRKVEEKSRTVSVFALRISALMWQLSVCDGRNETCVSRCAASG